MAILKDLNLATFNKFSNKIEDESCQLNDAQAASHTENKNPMAEYWLKAIKNSEIIGPQIMEKDQPVMKFLTKITATKNEYNTEITVEFHFDENKWFTNKILQKVIKLDKEKQQPISSTGDNIEWNDQMNYTMRKINSKNKKKKAKAPKSKKEPSFFHFFNGIDVKEDP